MEPVRLGPLIVMLGLVLVLLAGSARRRLRARKTAPSPLALRLHSWGSLAAFALLLVGLYLMWLEK